MSTLLEENNYYAGQVKTVFSVCCICKDQLKRTGIKIFECWIWDHYKNKQEMFFTGEKKNESGKIYRNTQVQQLHISE